jgi:hypothetical protein
LSDDERSRLLATLAVEVWRLRRRLNAESVSGRTLASCRRLEELLLEGRVRVDDPLGEDYVDGSLAEVIDAPPNWTTPEQRLVVVETLRPAVFLGEVCIMQPQVLLDYKTEGSENGDH